MTMTEQQIDQQIESLQLQKLRLKSRRRWTCAKCNKQTSVSKLIVIKQFAYEEPYGCSGGDNWYDANDYNVWCNKCNQWSRIYLSPISEYTIPSHRERIDEQRKRNPKFYFIYDHLQFAFEVLSNYSRRGEAATLQQLRDLQKKRRR